ncbi:putative Polyprotein [Cucumis melo var. makuwa]|uniref:Polyprotein n=1 Tax=Cucumis melo var. makuwa TaxID=1194695 RepID=A0A5A7ULL6_CUCMM|nr:putative Polyprotein [Cucumis melo var. makuwa]TYK14605.1 putative Polyprotein [Cucumis melo var. makuwa]
MNLLSGKDDLEVMTRQEKLNLGAWSDDLRVSENHSNGKARHLRVVCEEAMEVIYAFWQATWQTNDNRLNANPGTQQGHGTVERKGMRSGYVHNLARRLGCTQHNARARHSMRGALDIQLGCGQHLIIRLARRATPSARFSSYGQLKLFQRWIVSVDITPPSRDHHTIEVTRTSKVELKFTSGKTIILKEVLHTLEIRKNLVSNYLLNKRHPQTWRALLSPECARLVALKGISVMLLTFNVMM